MACVPLSIEIQEDGVTVHLVASGSVSGRELVEANEAFFGSSREPFRRCRFWISDYSAADLGEVDGPSLRRVSEISLDAARSNPDLVVAIIAGADLSFGFARMWEAFSSETGWRVRVVRSPEEARRWIADGAPVE